LGSRFSSGSPRFVLLIRCHQPSCGLCFQGFLGALSISLLNLLMPHQKHQQITTLNHKQTHAYAKRPTPNYYINKSSKHKLFAEVTTKQKD